MALGVAFLHATNPIFFLLSSTRWKLCLHVVAGLAVKSIKVTGIPAGHIVVDGTSITTKQIDLNREEIENDTINLVNYLVGRIKYFISE